MIRSNLAEMGAEIVFHYPYFKHEWKVENPDAYLDNAKIRK